MSFSRLRTWMIALPLLLALMLIATWALHENFTTRVPGANDFFSRWGGAHLYFTRGWDPYGDDATLWIQERIYGRAATRQDDASLFWYPFYTIFFIAPYALLPYDWAQAAWQITLLAVLIAMIFLLLHYFQWKPRPIVLGLLMLWSILFYPSARSLILGQLGLLVALFTFTSVWLIFRKPQPCQRCDLWAGILLAFTTIKPQMQFLVIPLIILWAARQRRWRIWIGFLAAFGLMVIASFIMLPGWLVGWIDQLTQYNGSAPPGVLYIMTHELLPLGSAAAIIEQVLRVALLLYVFFAWWQLFQSDAQSDSRHIDWVIGLTLVCTHFIVPNTATTHYVIFLFVLLPFFRDLTRRGVSGSAILLAVMLILLVGMWWLFLATITGNREANIVHVPLPVTMFVLLMFTRPQHPSRRLLEAA